MAILNSKKPKKPKRAVYEPSHFVWLKPINPRAPEFYRMPRQPALVLYGEKDGVIVVYVTPMQEGDTGRREVTHEQIEGMIT